MKAIGCPDPEEIARFALGEMSAEERRRVVRHTAECALCRRQAELLSISEETPLPRALGEGVFPVEPAPRPKTWHRIAQAVAAAAVAIALFSWIYRERASKAEPVVKSPSGPPRPPEKRNVAPEAPPKPPPLPNLPEPLPVENNRVAVPLPPERVPAPVPREAPAPLPPIPALLAERSRSEVTQAIEIAAGRGDVSVASDAGVSPLARKAMISPSDRLVSPGGGSVVLPDGATVHLARETELGLSWSQTLACATLDVHKGDALIDLGTSPRPLHVAHGKLGLRFQQSAGWLWVSAEERSLRATPLSGSAEFRTTNGQGRKLELLQSLVLKEDRDALEAAENVREALKSRFSTLEPEPRAPEPPAAADKRPPSADVLLAGLAGESYSYRVVGRQVREGVWSPWGLCVSKMDDITAVRRLDDKQAVHLRHKTRAWDDLSKVAWNTREGRIVEILRAAQAPHVLLQDMLPFVRAESKPRTEQIRDRVCTVWEATLDPAAVRDSVDKLFELAIQEGRLEKPDFVYRDTAEGVLEFAMAKFDPRLVRVVDRRKVAYSYKTFGGTDRRWYHLETVYEFSDHGTAKPALPQDMMRVLFPGRK